MNRPKQTPPDYAPAPPRSSPDEDAGEPWRLAVRNSGRVLLLFVPLAAIKALRHGHLALAESWWVVTLIPLGLVAACFAHAYLAAAIGRRRAGLIFTVALGALLVGGLYALTRYLGR